MLTQMTDADWEMVVEAFRAARSRRGQGPGRPQVSGGVALFRGSQHHLAGFAGGVWPLEQCLKRFWRLSQRGVFEAMLAILAGMSGTAHLVQMIDSTIVRAHVSAAGANVWPAPSASDFRALI